MEEPHILSVKPLLAIFLIFGFILSFLDAETQYHEFNIQAKPVKRLCRTHNTITVNGQFPGPTLAVRDGDTLVIRAINNAQYNITLHWHGVRQLRNPWADGPAYVTQCPIQPGQSYTYHFTIQNQEGTLWWHAHHQFLRATVYGALIIYPKFGTPYPFPMPKREIPILLGEWWDRNPQDVLKLALFTGAAMNLSNAYTINGQPGDLYRCSNKETVIFPVEAGEAILLRIINSAMNQELFFGVANHKLTVVSVDSAYTKPFTTSVIMIGPGQTTNALLTADQPPARYYIAAEPYNSANVAFDNTTTTAILEYKSAPCSSKKGKNSSTPIFPQLPGFNDTATATAFTAQLRSPHKVDVPTQIDENLFFTVGLGLINCSNPNSPRCQGPNGTRFAASINNQSFVLPTRNSIMQAYYQGQPGIFTTDFPPVPPVKFDYTGNVSRGLWQPVKGTKVYKLKFGSTVQIVLQDTSIISVEDHPMHLHGYEFYVVGSGFGNFDPSKDTSKFNLIDPPKRNTIGTSPGGWVAIRFVANNPGAWLFHCHIDSHLTWGLATSFLVQNGVGELQSVQPPPVDLPRC
ncbi:Cu-oxidase domain-containing protein/Cu-oxidase_2 domain-containing protein/Cu-oxidase_3 domain-containing protein [Cephalotus follicularis]|uniref:Laccase n=1 Tax=Cephalotus follicularis TaxID=3775 RepID=A0A1Q3ASG1_CEPFO|nr:Cu-oxidase domain-containing protein/Cu-oxidase_2 domain-containing protein/Cu-oxidase_3 domain-containing protein [Cephalotus follicularis]